MKKNSIYISAVRYFESGEIDKALKKCEEGISLNLKDIGTLNLKGLLLYLKGDLNGAVAAWKINSEFNDDITARNYMIDSKGDIDKYKLYNQGERLLRNMRIDEAINIFEQCRESDFNKINVNLLLAICYFKKGDYAKSSIYLSKVLEIDRNNKKAIEVKNDLKKYAGIKLNIKGSNLNFIKVVITILAMSTLVLTTGGIYIYSKHPNNSKIIQSTSTVDNTKKEVKEPQKMIQQQEKGETKDEVLVNAETIQLAISNKDYDKLYDLIEPLGNKELNSKEKLAYVNAKAILTSDEAINHFYQEGMDSFKSSKYDQALSAFQKVHKYGEKNYLYQHSIYFIGVTNNKLGDKMNAISAFEEYFQKYQNGSYTPEVAYTLALLYKDVDLDKCRTYAEYLVNNYPNSMYNNETISNLLEQIK